MLHYLTDKMNSALRTVRGLHKISEDNIQDALKEVKSALLSADVHFKVTKDFIETVKKDLLGTEVLKTISPGQQAIKIINDQLIALLGNENSQLLSKNPLHILMLGLHGAGKTTSSVKLARFLKKQGMKPILIACDVYRPAAIDQLIILGNQEDILVHSQKNEQNVIKIAQDGLQYGQEQGANVFIFDTAGRLQIDPELIQELKDLYAVINPDETLLVADSALGQEAVNVAQTFNQSIPLTGIILTKLDGDARGGAALSMKAITGVPIKFMATGEKMGDFSLFHPERIAQRILGMGDIVSLVEKAQSDLDTNEMERLQKRMGKAQLDLNDFLSQICQMEKLGSMSSIAKMLPGMHNLTIEDKQQKQLKNTKAILCSMTIEERTKPNILNGSRRMRIAKGSGTSVRDVNQVLSQFEGMKTMLKKMKGSGMKKMMQQLQSGQSPQDMLSMFKR